MAGDSDELSAIMQDVAAQLYNEQLAAGSIHPDLYRATADRLMAALFSGLGGTTFDYGSGPDIIKPWLTRNIYKFSAAKSLAELQEFRDMMVDEEGKRVPFKQFRDALAEKGVLFNKTHLATEYDNAEQSAVMARKWEEMTATNEWLEYSTVGDDRVRPAHAALDGITLHRDSHVWNRIWPPNDWNCRCTVIPGIAHRAKGEREAGVLAKGAVTDPLFDNNVGKSRVVFEDGHPYFEKAGMNKKKQLDAVANYGLPPVSNIYADPSRLPVRAEVDTEADYHKWWEAQEKLPGTDDILLKDKLGNNVLFDSWKTKGRGKMEDYFRDHAVRKKDEARHEYAANFPDIVQQPDEVWTGKENGQLVHYYIKYYSDAPYVVVVNGKPSGLVAETVYKLEMKRATELRRGILLYKK